MLLLYQEIFVWQFRPFQWMLWLDKIKWELYTANVNCIVCLPLPDRFGLWLLWSSLLSQIWWYRHNGGTKTTTLLKWWAGKQMKKYLYLRISFEWFKLSSIFFLQMFCWLLTNITYSLRRTRHVTFRIKFWEVHDWNKIILTYKVNEAFLCLCSEKQQQQMILV